METRKVDINTQVAELIGSLQIQIMALQAELKQAKDEIEKLKHGKHLSKTV